MHNTVAVTGDMFLFLNDFAIVCRACYDQVTLDTKYFWSYPDFNNTFSYLGVALVFVSRVMFTTCDFSITQIRCLFTRNILQRSMFKLTQRVMVSPWFTVMMKMMPMKMMTVELIVSHSLRGRADDRTGVGSL